MPTVGLQRGVKLVVYLSGSNDRRKVLTIAGCRLSKDNDRAYFALEPSVIDDLEKLFPDTLVIESAVNIWCTHQKLKAQTSARIAALTDTELPYEWTKPLRHYQKVGARWLSAVGRGMLCDEVGLGKTVESLAASQLVGSRRTLVVAPGYLLHEQWERQLKLWLPEATITLASGTRAQRQAALKQDAEYTLINHEMLRSKATYPELWNKVWDTIIIDEAHRFQGRDSQQSHGLNDLRTANLYLLTATPIWNRVDSLWHLLHVLDPQRFSSYWDFVETYCTVRKRPWGIEIAGPNPLLLDRLRSIIGPLMLRRKKEDVAPELPPKIYVDLSYQLTARQMEAYRKMRKTLFLITDTVEKKYISQAAMVSDLRLMCVAPQLLGLEGEVSAKDDLILQILRDNEDVPTVIFTWYIKYANYLADLLRGHGVNAVLVTGNQNPVERSKRIATFRAGRVDVLVGTIGSIGEGMDLDFARVAIFAEQHYVPVTNHQAEGRLHRLTTPVSPTIYRVFAEKTVEEHIMDVTATKTDIADEVLAVEEIMKRLAADAEEEEDE